MRHPFPTDVTATDLALLTDLYELTTRPEGAPVFPNEPLLGVEAPPPRSRRYALLDHTQHGAKTCKSRGSPENVA